MVPGWMGPLCVDYGHPFLDSKHLCLDDDDDDDNQNSKRHSTCGSEEDILDYKACHDVVAKYFFSPFSERGREFAELEMLQS